ncbi:MAG: PLP-dependent aminotransferase family protein, partial [Pseudomonadota bacterium]
MLKNSWKPEKNAPVPLYEQIKDYIRERISAGEWKIGSRIPTQRQLAELFEVNRSTVVTAVEDLIAEGLLEGRTKSGTTVKNNTWSLLSNKPAPDWTSYVRSGTHQPNFNTIQQINKYEFDPSKIRLGTGELSPKLFPKRLMSKAAERFIGEMNSLGYEEPKGSLALRKCICDYLKPRGITADPSQVLIVSGALQALHLISVGILYKGSTVLTENPSYIYSINVLQSAGMRLFGIPMDSEGIMVDRVLKHRRQTNAAMLYTIPSFHNPTGISMSDGRRRKLLEACESERLPIIEDDVYRELYIDGAAPVPIKALDKNGQVLYLGSLSKTLCPGFRIGWMVGQEAVIERLADIKMQTDYGSSSISQ